MDVREYLGQLKNIDQRIQDKLNEANKWRDIAYGINSPLFGDKVQKTVDSNKMEEAIINSIEYYNECKELANDYVQLKHKIINEIDAVTNDSYYNLLKGYYIRGESITQLAMTLMQSPKQVRRNLNKAIDYLSENVLKCP